MDKFIFDGPTLSIVGRDEAVVNGVFTFTTVELYSAWKAWVFSGAGAGYPPAFSVLGGEDLGGGVKLGTYVFIRNDLGWRGVTPFNGGANIHVNIVGNLIPIDIDTAYIDSWPGVTTHITAQASSLTQAITSVQNVVTGDLAQVPDAVWDHSKALTVSKFLGLK
jgi:hypothetical protein